MGHRRVLEQPLCPFGKFRQVRVARHDLYSMKLDAHIDVDVVAVEQEDEVTVMLELVGAGRAARRARAAPATVQVVLDRSGSMSGERLDAAQRALARARRAAGPGATASASSRSTTRCEVVVPAGPLLDKAAPRGRDRWRSRPAA